MLCSSLDAIGDTEMALDAYLGMAWPRDPGAKYIAIYGVLQTLFVQQEAVENLAQSLEIEYEPDPTLGIIREVRNDSVGHPTKRGKGKGRSYNFISRISMRHEGFTLLTSYSDERPDTFKEISIPSLIHDQRDVLGDVLSRVEDHLAKEEMEHIKRFEGKLLQDVFPGTFRYHLSKVGESIYGSGTRPIALAMVDLEMVEGTLVDFRALLAERGEAGAYQGVEEALNLLDYPLSKLRSFLEGTSDSGFSKQDAYIYYAFTSDRFDELMGMAKELDEPYLANEDT